MDTLMIFTIFTLSKLVKMDNSGEALYLYVYYYIQKKHAGNDTPWASTSYCARCLKWSETKVQKVRESLINTGLIQYSIKNENGKEIESIEVMFLVTETEIANNFVYIT